MFEFLKNIFRKKKQNKLYQLTVHHCSIDERAEQHTKHGIKMPLLMGNLKGIKHLIFSHTSATSFTLIEDPAKCAIYLIFDIVPSNLWDLFHQYVPFTIGYEFFDKKTYVDMKG